MAVQEPNWNFIHEQTIETKSWRTTAILRRAEDGSTFAENFRIEGFLDDEDVHGKTFCLSWADGAMKLERFTMDSRAPIMKDDQSELDLTARDSNEGYEKAKQLAWDPTFLNDCRRLFLGE